MTGEPPDADELVEDAAAADEHAVRHLHMAAEQRGDRGLEAVAGEPLGD